MAIAFRDFVGPLQLLVVLVFHSKSAADVLDAILVRRRVVATRCFVTH
jgi:hypothetical protein